MTPNQYIVLTHSSLPFSIHVHFANSTSKKRWGPEGPFGGSFEKVVCERDIDKRLEYAQVEVAYIAYFGTHGKLGMTSSRMFLNHNTLQAIHTYNPLLGIALRS